MVGQPPELRAGASGTLMVRVAEGGHGCGSPGPQDAVGNNTDNIYGCSEECVHEKRPGGMREILGQLQLGWLL